MAKRNVLTDSQDQTSTPMKREDPVVRALVSAIVLIATLLAIVLGSGLLKSAFEDQVAEVEQRAIEANEEFIEANPSLGLNEYVSRESATSEGLTSSLASSLCLTAVEDAGIKLYEQPASILSASGDNAYSVYSTKANDAFYVRVWDADSNAHLCKATGSTANPSVFVL